MILYRTQGNTQRVIIPMSTRTLHEDGSVTVAPYIPAAGDKITATLAGCRVYRYRGQVESNNFIFTLEGNELADRYSLELEVLRGDGTRMRYKIPQALELTDATTTDDAQGAEFTVNGVTLDAAWFFFAKGDKGDDGRGVAYIVKVGSFDLIDTYRIAYTDGGISTFEVTNGRPGKDGRGIETIAKTSSEGLVDTYTITYTDGTTSTYTVTNGSGGESLERVELVIDDNIHYKGDTTPLTYVQVRALVEDTTKFVTLYDGFNLFLPSYDDEGGAVIFSSAYIQNGSPQIMRVAINSENLIKYKGAVMEYATLKTDDLNKEGAAPWFTYPTTKAVNEALQYKVPTSRTINAKALSDDVVLNGADIKVDVQKSAESLDTRTVTLQALLFGYNTTKQATLVSGENIKTINGESVLGEGNIEIQGGAEVVQTTGQATDKVMSQKAVTEAINNIPMPSGGEWEFIAELNITEAVNQIIQDLGGEYREVLIVGNPSPEAITSGASGNSWKFSPTASKYSTMAINTMAVSRHAYIHCFIRGGFIYCLSNCQLAGNSGQNPILSGSSTTLTSFKNIGLFVDNAGMGVKGHLQIYGKK